jgi:23S rRNA (guanosine2251-2'-O)-methyltransferase
MSNPQLIYGLHAVQSLLKRHPERVLELRLAERRDDPRMRAIEALALEQGTKVVRVEAQALHQALGEVTHQGVAAEVLPLEPWSEDDLMSALGDAHAPLVLALDGVQDPHNLGACLRSADACGALAVVVPKDRAAHLTPVVRKVAAGAAEFVPVATVTNLARALDMLKERNVWVVGTDGDAPETLYGADLNRPLALVLGAEGGGMRRLTRERCDFLVRIPMAGQVESLNVSVAAGIALFEARRQRGAPELTKGGRNA